MSNIGYWATADADGRIVTVGSGSTQMAQLNAQQDADAEYFTVRPDPRLHYVKNGNLEDRPEFPAFDKTSIVADGKDAATLEGLPEGTTVQVDGIVYTVDDGVFVFRATMPATYVIRVENWPHQVFEQEVDAL